MKQQMTSLESFARTAIANDARRTGVDCARQKRAFDQAFRSLLVLLKPRIRQMIANWGLRTYHDDAVQAANIGVFKALETFDPDIAQFSTHVNFRLRAQMKDLRFHFFRDERSDALKVGAKTISADTPLSSEESGASLLESVEAENALEETMAATSDWLAQSMTNRLLDRYERIEMNQFRLQNATVNPLQLTARRAAIRSARRAFELRIFCDCTYEEVERETGLTRGRIRQIETSVREKLVGIVRDEPSFALARVAHPAIVLDSAGTGRAGGRGRNAQAGMRTRAAAAKTGRTAKANPAASREARA